MIVERPSSETAVKVEYSCEHGIVTRWHLITQVTYKEDHFPRIDCAECKILVADGLPTKCFSQIKKAILLDEV